MTAESTRNNRKELIGSVRAKTGDKSIKVVYEYKTPHPLYKKEIRRKTTVHVHDEKNESLVGDKVKIVATRPLSKLKRWRVLEIIEKAKELLGTPYLWGGNSTKGSDCSGFTQLLFKSEGFFLPRDARQQASLGKKINIHELLQGDLIFFGSKEKVTHVGISLGGYDYIHQGGKVEIHSLDEKSKIFNSSRAKTYMFAKRILN